MQQHFIYFLYSKSIDRFYIGETSNLKNRLILHQKQHYKGSFTKSAKDWEIVFSKKCDSKQDALFLEKFIKRMKSKKFILKVIKNPEILDDILNNK
ncbi:GIY-YIG nuclease family protein [Cellulophaga lytica]|uniref:Excinuclease ABC C subunit domain protein n=1 Tax=Cellulophaga lytica (strain ATCC 23178 / DSM 7489 / JCM 8516 / NBRC 14961 / NCIMB 1423 / VKM B-1433 / Cy l20) TaxID=867900 RepID=F0RCF8_CELLC|nr:GIY-YIG nuclease family protein [Cellulophaga lytica]ADY28635.1 Excinuclease ABC C subunit domain protein [Cellulophaga lytica DSM 7489]AIM59688.1 excinuclease ABC subunit C [Cellulophaga lytica]WQG77187.1 GIY-YIG nuclease family protein [Cellulophaga lytica]WQG77188.1 GIY-YIG nuclease family protein [Cellulophaga lytica]